MVKLNDDDIRTREVLDWQGLHLFHARMSSCSQKLRIFLRLKGIEWQPHEVDLGAQESYSDWFLGLNPRGLVPVLVWDGAVHIESNDIIELLEHAFPDPCLIPSDHAETVHDLLQFEDDLHLDLRRLSFRFVYGRSGSTKSVETMDRYRNAPGGDTARQKEIDFYDTLARDGITAPALCASAEKFRAAFDDLEARLAKGPYFLGQDLSVLDVAWFVYATRLSLAGYPFAQLHPRVADWHAGLHENPPFSEEVAPPPAVIEIARETRAAQTAAGQTLSDVAGFSAAR